MACRCTARQSGASDEAVFQLLSLVCLYTVIFNAAFVSTKLPYCSCCFFLSAVLRPFCLLATSCALHWPDASMSLQLRQRDVVRARGRRACVCGEGGELE
jgi:hypothetical protein